MSTHPQKPESDTSAHPRGFSAWTRRVRRRAVDHLRYADLVRRSYALASEALGVTRRDAAGKVRKCLDAFRFADTDSPAEARARRRLGPWLADSGLALWREEEIGWERFQGWKREGPVTRTIVLKAPSADGEKGVLLTSFEYNWFKLLRDPVAARELESRYDIIFSTTSCPGDYTMLGLALSTLSGPVYVMSCHYDEIAKFENFHPRVRCLPMLPCDWLEPDCYEPKPFEERSIDVLMVAGWGPVKRHWHFFESLRSLPATARVVLVGQPDGSHDREGILKLAAECRVPQTLEVRESLGIDEVSALQCDSRLSAIFSRREGCCVAVVESLLADSPVALVAGTHMGPAAYINEHTGRFLPLRGTGPALRDFFESAHEYRPREWAMSRLGNRLSAARCGDYFAKERARRGESWSGGLAVPWWRPHPAIPNAEITPEIRTAFEKLHRDFPALFSADLIQTSRR